MLRDEVMATLRSAEAALRERGVAALYLFGSHAREEARPQSDIDVFVDPVSNERFGFLEFMDAYQTIRSAFGDRVKIGYSTREGLSPYVRLDIEREAVKVF